MQPGFKTVALIGKYKSPEIADPLTALGGFLEGRGVKVIVDPLTAQHLPASRFEVHAVLEPAQALEQVPGPTVDASRAVFEQAGIGPGEIDLAQLQDTESGAEIMHMAENGFCADGEQERMLADGETRLDGRLPVNTDGGCLANAEPIGASGLRQIHENVVQLRGAAGAGRFPGSRRRPTATYTARPESAQSPYSRANASHPAGGASR